MPTLINNAPTNASAKYSREPVERALTFHLGDIAWQRKGSGYTISTGVGVIELKSLREAAIFVYGCAEKARRNA